MESTGTTDSASNASTGTTSSVSIESTTFDSPTALRLAKLKQLKARRSELEALNRKAIFSDHRQQNMLRRKMKADTDPSHQLDQKTKDDEPAGSRNLSYSLQECEDWLLRKLTHPSLLKHDYNSLAAISYQKEVSELTIDQDAYRLNKNLSVGRLDKLPDFNVPTCNADKQALADALRESNTRKLRKQRRRGVGIDAGSYINEKNKQFNMKVNREYD